MYSMTGGHSPRLSHPTPAVRQRRRVYLKAGQAALPVSTPDGEHCDGISASERGVGADRADAVKHGQVHSQGQLLPAQQVGELVFTPIHLSNRSTHAALAGAAPFPKMHKEAGHLTS